MIATQSITASAVFPDGTTMPLNVTEWNVTMDETWSPFVQSTVIVTAPANADILDPRLGVRVNLNLTQRFNSSLRFADISAAWAGKTFADVTYPGTLAAISAAFGANYNAATIAPITRTFDLLLRERTYDRAAGTITLTLGSDEFLLQDYRRMAATVNNLNLTTVRATANYVLGLLGAALTPGPDNGTVLPQATAWQPGVTAWDLLQPLAESAGLRLYCDENRQWFLTPPLSKSTAGLLDLNPIITQAEDTLSVEADWADGVMVKYAYKDASGVESVNYDIANPEARKPLLIERTTNYPGPGAATAILARVKNNGRSIRSQAVSRFDATPGQALRIDLNGIPIQTGTVSALEWTGTSGEMTISSRDLVDVSANAWRLAPASRTWANATGTWATYKN